MHLIERAERWVSNATNLPQKQRTSCGELAFVDQELKRLIAQMSFRSMA